MLCGYDNSTFSSANKNMKRLKVYLSRKFIGFYFSSDKSFSPLLQNAYLVEVWIIFDINVANQMKSTKTYE